MNIAIAGGSGFIGQHLISIWLQDNHRVVLISRKHQLSNHPMLSSVTWDELKHNPERLEGMDAIVNLAGESINQRWTDQAKQRILHSRLETVALISDVIRQLKQKPSVVINASGMSIYGLSETQTFDESSPHTYDHFLSNVVRDWEAAATKIEETRVVLLRIGIVLGMDGGAFPKMYFPYKMFVGGKVGSGRQWLSWIHVEDMVRLVTFCIENKEISGPVNCTAPNPVTNDEFGRTISRVANRPHWMPVPSVMMKLIFGELSVLLLKGQKVLPQKALDHQFQFRYPVLEPALRCLIG